EFAGNDEVAVIVDRRLGERRLRELGHGAERRQADRRQAVVDERLRSMGWAIVWRSESTTVYVPRGDALLLPPEPSTPPSAARGRLSARGSRPGRRRASAGRPARGSWSCRS